MNILSAWLDLPAMRSEGRVRPVNVSFLQELLNGIAEQGRHLLPRSLGRTAPKDSVSELAEALLSGRGEASGVAIAREILETYRGLPREERIDFLTFLARNMQPDNEAVTR